ncbi:MAG: hypothetical protein ABI651_16195 [Verrucomicrobiota bacterium]
MKTHPITDHSNESYEYEPGNQGKGYSNCPSEKLHPKTLADGGFANHGVENETNRPE